MTISFVVSVVWAWKKETEDVTLKTQTKSKRLFQFKGSILDAHLHGGAISLASNQGCRDVCVCILIVKIHHIGHPPWQEKLVPLIRFVLEQHPIDVTA